MKHTILLASIVSVAIGAVSLAPAMFDTNAQQSAIVQAASEDDLIITAYSDSATVKKCNSGGDIVIPDTYNGVPVTSIVEGAFKDCIGITSVTIPESVTQIPAECFYGCSKLKSVNIPSSATSIGEFAFGYCSSLISIDCPESISAIDSKSLQGCSLDSLTIRNPNCSMEDILGTPTYGSIQTIYGYAGSTVETYARRYAIPFVALENKVITTAATKTGAVLTTTGPDNITTARSAITTTTKKTGFLVTTTALRTTLRTLQKTMFKYDVNGDNSVNIADCVLLTRLVAEDNTVTYPKKGNPDVNGDGVLTMEDVVEVLNSLRPFCITIGKTSAKPGAKVSVPIQIYGDKGTAGGQVYISYDSKLTPVSVKAGDAYTTTLHSEADGYPIYIGWNSQNGLEQTAQDGSVLAYLEFEVDPNIKQTEYLEISVMQSGTNSTRFSDSDGFLYQANYRSGYITILP